MKLAYYWISKALKNIPTNDTPYWNALLIVWLIQMLNIGFVYGVFRLLFSFEPMKADNTIGDVLFAISMLAMNYFWLFRDRKKIFQKYNRMDIRKSNRSQLYVWIYVIASIVLFFLVIANFDKTVKDPIQEHIKEIRKQ